LSGTFSAVVNRQIVASRGAGEHVGEMALLIRRRTGPRLLWRSPTL
jgi:hypothetical protein